MSNTRHVNAKRLAAVFATIFLMTTAAQVASAAEIPPAEDKKHLDWDSTDQVWRCVGSPVDCAF